MFGNQSFRTQRFGAGGSSIRASGNTALDLAEMVRAVPAVAAEAAHESRSARFVPIPTLRLVEQLGQHGFLPYEARQGGSRVEGKREFTKHLIRFRHPDMRALQDGQNFPEIILLNANDGTSSYQLLAGVFRIVCKNGLIAGDNIRSVRVTHTGTTQKVIENVIEASYTVVEETPVVARQIADMRDTKLHLDDAMAFAREAANLRWTPTEEDPNPTPIPVGELLRPRRTDDRANDVWTVFNVVQENLLRGGQAYRTQRAYRTGTKQVTQTVREVRSIDDSTHLNRALWDAALKRVRKAA